jgi:hypothetical protein
VPSLPQVERPGSAERRIGGTGGRRPAGAGAPTSPQLSNSCGQQLATASLPRERFRCRWSSRPTAPPEPAAVTQPHAQPLLLRLSNLQLSLAPAEVERLTRTPAGAAQLPGRAGSPRSTSGRANARLRFTAATGAVTVLSPGQPGRALGNRGQPARLQQGQATRQASGVEFSGDPAGPSSRYEPDRRNGPPRARGQQPDLLCRKAAPAASATWSSLPSGSRGSSFHLGKPSAST